MKELINKILHKENLNQPEIELIMTEIMSGKVEKEDIKAFLLGIRDKGATVEELTGAARIMRKFVIGIQSKHDKILDTCGTGGDKKNTFNISTTTALVVAGAGGVVAKHGNRSVTSKCGSACVLEGLGVNLDVEHHHLQECLDEVGIAFLFAQKLHPAMKNVAVARKELGVETIFNMLGPLTNPANATHQVMGVYNRDMLEPMANVLKGLGLQKALVVHGSDGLDEMTTTGLTYICEYNGNEIINYDISPEELGFGKAEEKDLVGGNIDENVQIVRNILDGEIGPKRDIVVLNAAYALYILDVAANLKEAVSLAQDSIDAGKAKAKLKELVDFTHRFKL